MCFNFLEDSGKKVTYKTGLIYRMVEFIVTTSQSSQMKRKKIHTEKILLKRKYKEINVHEFNCFPLFTFLRWFLNTIMIALDKRFGLYEMYTQYYIQCSIIYYKYIFQRCFCILFDFCF